MRLRVALPVALSLALVTLAFGAGLQVWPKIQGHPNFHIGIPDSWHAQHPIDRESYGEGWFWMGAYDDGSYHFANFMVTNLGPGDQKGTVDATIWEPGGTTHMARLAFDKDSFKASKDRLDVKIGQSRIWGSQPNFHLQLAAKDVALDLNYQAQLPGVALNSGRVIYGDPENFYSVYTTIPRAKISGRITTPSGSREVNGYGYSDHGVVTMLPHQYSKRWYTLRCFHEKYTFDILEFTVPPKWGSQRVGLAILGRDDKILYAGSRYALTGTSVQREPKWGVPFPRRYDFSIDRPGKVKLSGHYTVKQQMHAIDVLSQLSFLERQIAKLFAKSYILRFLVEVTAEVTLPDGTTEKFTAPGVAEVVQIK